MEDTAGVGATWEGLVTLANKEDIQGVMVGLLVDMGTLVLPGVWGVLAMAMGDRALVTVALGHPVVMEQQEGVTEQIKEDLEEETLHQVEEVPGVIVVRGTRIEDFQVTVLVLVWLQDCVLPGTMRQEYSLPGTGDCQEL